MKAFITGASGFAGSFLSERLLNSGYAVFGTYLSEKSLENLSHIKNKINLVHLDLLDEEKTNQTISDIRPDLIFHLAAFTSPAESFKNPKETFDNNISAELNIFESVVKNKLLDTKILVVSSSEIYGVVKPEDIPVDEDTPLRPGSPYAVSKIAQDFLGFQYFLSAKLKIVRVRPYNHSGPRQAPIFVISSFAKKIADIEKGKEDPVLKVGNLDARRDFTDVRDMVEAYVLALEKGEAGEVYNLGFGKSQKIGDILEMLLNMSTKKDIKVEKDPSLFRPVDVPDIVSDSTKFRKLTGWKPQISIEKTLQDTLDYWRDLS
ncbi:MAG: GDP-mannose 4,6-dehydratase [Candidatus Levybacteria bacterium]|nr:GDP-mannose 4,6-dehydratase [Candidatus Levybacteria bacterium]MBI2420534.1 GDP-mannose 4,6-dehydratase [Candidatus Levybacteria bacterium]